MEERSNTEEGELVIDMTLSDDEETSTNTKQGNKTVMTILKPHISLEVSAASANVPTSLEASSVPTEILQKEGNPMMKALLENCPSADGPSSQQDPAPIIDPNVLSILGNYTPSELARVTTQAMIECISRFPALWDSKEPSFHNHKYCSVLWKNIAVVLNINAVKKAKAKWYSLRSGYRKEYFKSKETGIPSRFAYFEALSFLEAETLREKERGDSGKLKVSHMLSNRNSISNGSNGTNGLENEDDDDCMIVENLEACAEGSTTVIVPESSSTDSTTKQNQVNCKPDGTHIETQMMQSANGEASAREQAKPTFLIRPKNISELMAVPSPTPLEPTTSASEPNACARSVSPEIAFVSEKPQPIHTAPKIVVSDAFPSVSNDSVSNEHLKPKADIVQQIRSSMKKYIDKSPSNPSKKEKGKTKSLKSSKNGSATAADFTAFRFLKGPYGLQKSGNKTSSPPKKPDGTDPGKRTLDVAPGNPKPAKKAKFSNLETSIGMNRPRDARELTEVNKGFLISLLPDVEGMTNAEFRTFKKQATALVSVILDR